MQANPNAADQSVSAGAPNVGSDAAFRRRISRWGLLGCALIGLGLLTIPLDAVTADIVSRFIPEDTIARRVVKLPNHFFAKWGFVIVPAMLLLFRDRWRLLIGFGLPMGVGAAVHLVKFLVGRARPTDGGTPFDFHFLHGDPRMEFDSFPSAHAAFAMILTALLGLYFPMLRRALIPLVVLVCLGRVAQDRHFVSDVIAGVGFGLIAVWLVARRLGCEYYPALRFSAKTIGVGPMRPDSTASKEEANK
ncbi:MAG: phosphatase PAP2 family protein [Phycisphaerae bacterium]